MIFLFSSCRFFNSHDREFHVASLPYKPDFKVMPEGWDGTTRDPDEVLYEISIKEDQMLYEEFVQRLNFNKKKVSCIYFPPFVPVFSLIKPVGSHKPEQVTLCKPIVVFSSVKPIG